MTTYSQPLPLEIEAPSNWRARWLFPAYLVFSVVFYAHRYIMGWGPADLTAFDTDTPNSIRIVKDLVWLLFLALSLPALRRFRWSWFASALAAFALWFMIAGTIHYFFWDDIGDVALFWFRYPLEYIPLVFLVPICFDEPKRFATLAIAMGWLATGFLLFEALSDRESGFWGLRYGSVFGSPNDYGIFCAYMLLALVVFGKKWHHWLLASGLALGMLAAGSRSAWVGFVLGMIPFLATRRILRLVVATATLLIGVFVLYTYGSDDVQKVLFYAEQRVTAVDESTQGHIAELDFFSGVDASGMIAGERHDLRHTDSTPVLLVMRTGIFGLLLFLLITIPTVIRGWRLRKCSPVHAAGLIGLLVILGGSLFIRYIDVFPTNMYLWFAVGLVWLPHRSDECLSVE